MSAAKTNIYMPLVFAADSQQNWWLCDQPKDPGPCYAHIPRYYYDSSSGQCEEFIYGGCLGNSNRFLTQKECEQACVRAMTESICHLSPESGPCKGYFPSYYFNSKSGQCERFVYRGCGGSDNRFSTKQKCEQECGKFKKDICLLPLDMGFCNLNSESYYFNSKTLQCEKFIYRGCSGNENRFSTKQECEKACDKKDICTLPQETGSCKEEFTSYYFNFKTGQCEKFTYSGCGGNDNRFSTKHECEQTCGKYRLDPCTLPQKPGLCLKFFTRYYFNSKNGQCEEFKYSCGGNANRFLTKKECKQACSRWVLDSICTLPPVTGSCKPQILMYYYNSISGRCQMFVYGCGGNDNQFSTKQECEQACGLKDICSLPQETGPCKAKVSSYHFNFKSGQCEEFLYSGCGGNDNRFSTKQKCEQACSKNNICTLPKKTELCSGFFPSYYFNSETSQCEWFIYSGCDGNDNRFSTKQECEQTCGVKDPCIYPMINSDCLEFHPSYYYSPKFGVCQKYPHRCGKFKHKFLCEQACVKKDICTLPMETGPCYFYKSFPKYYFNSKTGQCEEFLYSGCGGNDNRFSTKQECEKACKKGICTLPQDAGPCTPPQKVTRYYFNSKTGKCEKFLYGGCRGNENRFSMKKECEQACDKKVICTLPQETGPCEESIPSFYFNSKNGQCERFTYSGCAGNNNRFSSKRDCEVVCGKKNICTQPQEKGTCKDEITNYYFNFKTNQCKKFTYSGCGGNDNQFSTKQECEKACVDICILPKERGTCRGHFSNYYFNSKTGQCKEFKYSGCGGNDNRFSTMWECQIACDKNDI